MQPDNTLRLGEAGNVADLLREVANHGIRLSLEGDRIDWEADVQPPADLLDRLRAAKPELVVALRGRAMPWRRPRAQEEGEEGEASAAEPDPYFVLLAEVARLDRRHPDGVESGLLLSNFVLALHELRQLAGLPKLPPAENLELFDAALHRAIRGPERPVVAEDGLLRRRWRWSAPEQPVVAPARPKTRDWADDRAWTSRFVAAPTLEAKRAVLTRWAEAMGGMVVDGAVVLPPLQPHAVRRLAEVELRRLLRQVGVEVREDDARRRQRVIIPEDAA
jgi:hypothetical protein